MIFLNLKPMDIVLIKITVLSEKGSMDQLINFSKDGRYIV